MLKRIKWCLVGIPDDEGIFNVGGRLGASQGPDALRKVMTRLANYSELMELGLDYGNVPLTTSIHQNYTEASHWIRNAQKESGCTIVVGGGHDHGYSQILGVHDHYQGQKKNPKIGVINIDAHLDLRKPEPLPSSGSPFYMAIESKILEGKNLIEFGIQKHCNGAELWNYARKHHVKIVLFDEIPRHKRVEAFKKQLTALSKRVDYIVISLDLDSLAEAYCPGVSAPQADGFNTSEIFEMIRLAAKNKKTVSLGIFELSPILDYSEQTARVAVGAAVQFISHKFF